MSHKRSALDSTAPSPVRELCSSPSTSRRPLTLSHKVLLGNIYNTNAPNYIKKWLAAYINGRSTYVEFREKTSKKKEGAAGSTQGGVLSPALFNTYMSSLPAPQDNVTLISYADGITIMSSAVQPEQEAGRD